MKSEVPPALLASGVQAGLALKGKRVLVTRPAKQAGDFVDKLRALGAEVISMPGLEIAPLRDTSALDQALQKSYEWIVFTSVNGVEASLSRPHRLHGKFAVVGPATASALRRRGFRAAAIPATHVGIAIADALGEVSGQRILLLRADRASPDLPNELRRRGAEVFDVQAYRILEVANSQPIEKPDYITLTSAGTAQVVLSRIPGDWIDVPIVCIGPVTANALEGRANQIIIAEPHTSDGIIDAILQHAGKC